MTFQLDVRWGPRSEPVSTCAARFAQMLVALAAIQPSLSDWRKKAKTRAAAYQAFCTMPPPPSELERVLLSGRHFASGSGELMPDLGYSVSAWNGLNKPRGLSLGLRVNVAYEPWLYPNDVTIEGLGLANDLVDASLLKRVMLAIAECWDADWGVVKTWDYKGLILDENGKPLLPYGGWLTFLSTPLAEKISPPSQIFAERLPNGGLMMTVSNEPLNVANPLHIARLDAVQKALAPVQRSITAQFHQFYPTA